MNRFLVWRNQIKENVMTLYKVLNEDGTPFWGGRGRWHLPSGKRKGKWMPPIKRLLPCRRGYHVLKPEQLIEWLGPAIFEAEVRGKQIWRDDKGVVEQARLVRKLKWDEQIARLFACDCAESVVHLVKDERSINAIRVSRRFAFGLAREEDLAASHAGARKAECGAAGEACASAWAAWSAARAAREAAHAARTALPLGDAMLAASRAASAALVDAQTKRLFQYLNGEVDLKEIRRSVA